MDVILDTNAIKYLYDIELGKYSKVYLNRKEISSISFQEKCSEANIIYIMSESLHELFLQSVKNTNNVNEFAHIYQFIISFAKRNQHETRIINDWRGIYFNAKKFSRIYKYHKKIDLKEFFTPRIRGERKIMQSIIFCINYGVFATIFDCIYDVDFGERYWNQINKYIIKSLEKFYYNYYAIMNEDINDFEKELDELIFIIFSYTNNQIRMLKDIDSENGLNIPNVSEYKSGSKYVKKLLINLRNKANTNLREMKKTPLELYELHIDEILKELQISRNFSSLQAQYYKYICMEFALGRHIRKNDVLDCSMVTALDNRDGVFNDSLKHGICFLTFDNFIYRFCQKNSIMFVTKVYEDMYLE